MLDYETTQLLIIFDDSGLHLRAHRRRPFQLNQLCSLSRVKGDYTDSVGIRDGRDFDFADLLVTEVIVFVVGVLVAEIGRTGAITHVEPDVADVVTLTPLQSLDARKSGVGARGKYIFEGEAVVFLLLSAYPVGCDD